MKPCNTQKHNLDRALLGSSYLLYMYALCVYMHVPGSQAPRLQNVNTEGVAREPGIFLQCEKC